MSDGVPYIRFFSDDWLAGTNDLSPAERGVLITIVAITASTGSPPKNDPDRLARRFGCTRASAKKTLAALIDLGKIYEVDGALFNDRAIKETEISQKKSQKNAENASKRWDKSEEKPNKNKGGVDAVALIRHDQPEPEPEPEVNTQTQTRARGLPEKVRDRWNLMAAQSGLDSFDLITPQRLRWIENRLMDCDSDEQKIFDAIDRVPFDPHRVGNSPGGWRASFDWVFGDRQKFAQCLETKTNQTEILKLKDATNEKRSKNKQHDGAAIARRIAAEVLRETEGDALPPGLRIGAGPQDSD